MSPEARRAQIVRVAAEHLALHGYEGASIAAIAAEAGVTRALVYHYFPGKEALLDAVLRRESDALLAATEPDPDASPRANLERALGAYLDHFAAARGRLRELYVPEAKSPSLVRELGAQNHLVQVDRLQRFLGQPDTPLTRLALGAWLAFVEEAARTSGETGVPRREVIRLCLGALPVGDLERGGHREPPPEASAPDRTHEQEEQES